MIVLVSINSFKYYQVSSHHIKGVPDEYNEYGGKYKIVNSQMYLIKRIPKEKYQSLKN